MDVQIALRFDAPIHEHLQQVAADLGLTLTEYIRLMACWHAPYMLLVTDARKIVQTGGEDLEQAMPRLRSAVERMEAGEAELDALVEKIQVGLPESQQRSREQATEFKTLLQERLAQFEAAAEAFRTVRKRLGAPPTGKKER